MGYVPMDLSEKEGAFAELVAEHLKEAGRRVRTSELCDVERLSKAAKAAGSFGGPMSFGQLLAKFSGQEFNGSVLFSRKVQGFRVWWCA